MNKVGVDDFLAAGHTVADLRALATPELRRIEDKEPGPVCPYEAKSSGIVWHRQTKEGAVETHLTNFTANILADVVEDDGAEARVTFEMEAQVAGRTHRFLIPAAQFSGLAWVPEHLGASALVYPGFNSKDNARAAIQMLSGTVKRVQAFTHMGWREVNGEQVYLHAAGAIGALGTVAEVQTRFNGALASFELTLPEDAVGLRRAVQASLAFLDVAPRRLTVPLLCASYRAVMGETDFGIHEEGKSGAFKSELAALVQRHFGKEMDARHFPASWRDTPNSLEGLAFLAKDAVLVIDDFAPTGSQADVQRFHAAAERIFRGQGNRSGRGRMRPDATLRPPKPPRGLVLSTGEDVPKGQSLRGRLLILDVGYDDVDVHRLTRCQQDAAKGLLAESMGSFIRWLAPQYQKLHAGLRDEIDGLREHALGEAAHRRTPEIVANLALGLRWFLCFAKEVGAIDQARASQLWSEGWVAIGEAAADQAKHQVASDPAHHFIELLGGAIVSGAAYVAAADGTEPDTAERWGWRRERGADYSTTWRPSGSLVGWVDGDNLYLDPVAAYAAAAGYRDQDGRPLDHPAPNASEASA